MAAVETPVTTVRVTAVKHNDECDSLVVDATNPATPVVGGGGETLKPDHESHPSSFDQHHSYKEQMKLSNCDDEPVDFHCRSIEGEVVLDHEGDGRKSTSWSSIHKHVEESIR